ncbi:hypothetical protein [Agrobacterium tumefaciens]|uniref:hypothetical protein n=1 Tax=Agrobacterium tumefaciens TaxID=358 RepID=UPI00157350EC|nr:hypothetical protein [Agrobacterium tumefaciens]
MIGAAESISDLRSLLSIVAEETGALKMNDANEDSVGWTTEGPLPMTFGHVRRAHAALAALEAALSPAEPVAWLPARRWEQMTAAEPWLTNIVYSQDQAKFFPCIPLYAAPPAPSVAMKPLEWSGPTPESNGCHVAKTIFGTYSAVNEDGWYVTLDDHPWGQGFEWSAPDMRMTFDDAAKAAQADYEARIRSALSAQVQDVAGWKPIETAPKDKTSIIIAVPTKDRDDWIVGEGYFDPDHYEDGDWWWANLDYSDYHAGPISDCNHWPPELWQPLPVPAAAPAKQEGDNVTSQ